MCCALHFFRLSADNGNRNRADWPPKRRAPVQLRQDNSQRQTQTQRIAPHLIQANTLLQCSNAELLQMIEQEQRENPALDDADDSAPLESDALTLSTAAPAADGPEAERQASGDEMEQARQEFNHTDAATSSLVSESDFDPMSLARAQVTLSEHLLSHLRASSHSPAEARIAEYLVDCLDEQGYLQVDLDEACAVLRVPCEAVKQGIGRLQECEPSGIGARDLRECLLLQMQHLREQSEWEQYDAVAERLLREHWDALIQRRHGRLARQMGISPAQIDAAVRFIQTRLTPHPAAQFRQPWDHRPDTQSVTVRPDVVIRRGAVGFEVDVLGFENLALQINPHYRTLYDAICEARTDGGLARVGGQTLTTDHKKHVIAYVERANLFLKNLQQRRRTIQKIALALVESQQGFLETGERAFLRPLTRTRLAGMVAMHESTISRALLHKFVQLPSQEVVSFDIFFEQAATAKGAVAALIGAEPPDAPLSDQAITDALQAQGMDVARRTVVKYREEMRIPASYLRRRR